MPPARHPCHSDRTKIQLFSSIGKTHFFQSPKNEQNKQAEINKQPLELASNKKKTKRFLQRKSLSQITFFSFKQCNFDVHFQRHSITLSSISPISHQTKNHIRTIFLEKHHAISLAI